jgi:hypothetical protein
MPIEKTVSVRSLNAKRGSILMEDASLILNNEGEVVCTSGSYPSSSGIVVAAALLALADSSDKDLYLPAIHAPPGPRTNCFSGNKAPIKTEIAAERKAAKEAKQKEAEGKKAAVAARKADGLAKKQEKRISSTKAKASTVAAKAKTLCSKLAEVMKSAAVPEAVHLHKKSKGVLGTAPINSPLAHTLSLSPQRKSMSAKKRVSVQSPLCSSYDKEDELSLDGSIMLFSSRSSGTSSTTTIEKEYNDVGTLLTPTALRHASLGRGNPAQRAAGDSAILPLLDVAVADRQKDVHLQELLLPMAAIKSRAHLRIRFVRRSALPGLQWFAPPATHGRILFWRAIKIMWGKGPEALQILY